MSGEPHNAFAVVAEFQQLHRAESSMVCKVTNSHPPRLFENIILLCTIVSVSHTPMASSQALCYYPVGNIASDHTPCNSSAPDTWCCHTNNYCLDNGHCLQATDVFANRLSRGSCTDRQWNSEACPFECTDGIQYFQCSRPVEAE
jgi:hypothetical protein